MTKINEIKAYTDLFGSIYGSEDKSILYYSLVKMQRPKNILELGTGLATNTLWLGLALKENNNKGKIITIDNGIGWELILSKPNNILSVNNCDKTDYNSYISSLIDKFNLNDVIQFVNQDIENADVIISSKDIDFLFCDFRHDPEFILNMFAVFITKMSDISTIVIDSVPTNIYSNLLVNKIIEIFNSGKIPKSISDIARSSGIDLNVLIDKIKKTEFQIIPIIENKKRNQNSSVMITLSPIDIFNGDSNKTQVKL